MSGAPGPTRDAGADPRAAALLDALSSVVS